MSSDTLLSIRAMPSHTHSAGGLRRCGHSAFGSGRGAGGAPAAGWSVVIAAVYARGATATMRCLARRSLLLYRHVCAHDGLFTGGPVIGVDRFAPHRE